MTIIRIILVIVSIVLLLSLTLIPCFADVIDEPEDYAVFPFIYYYLDSWGMDNIASNQLAFILDSQNQLFDKISFYSFNLAGGDEGTRLYSIPVWLKDGALTLGGYVWHEHITAELYYYTDQYDISAYHTVDINYYLDLVFDQDGRFADGVIEFYAHDIETGLNVLAVYYSLSPVIRSGSVVLEVTMDSCYIDGDELEARPWNFDFYVAFVPTQNTALSDMVIPIMGDDDLEYVRSNPSAFLSGYMGYVNEFLPEVTDGLYDDGFEAGKNVGESNVFLGGIFGDFFKGVTDAINNFTLFVYDNQAVTLGIVFSAGIGIALFIWILKIFAGG